MVEDEQPLLAVATPPTLEDTLAASLAALDLSAPGADTRALHMLRIALEGGLKPNPASVVAAHPEAPCPLTPIQSRSMDNWLGGECTHPYPTREELQRASKREAVRTSARDKEEAELLDTSKDHYPDANDPVALADYARKMGLPAFTPRTRGVFPLRTVSSAHGAVPSLDAEGMCKAHAEHCSRCQANSPCLAVAACHYLADASLPFSDPTLTSRDGLQPAPMVAPYDPELVAAVRKVQAVGALSQRPSGSITHYSHAFLAPALDVALSQEQSKDIAVGGEAGCHAAFAAAQPLATRFLAAYNPQGLKASQVLEAYQSAELATLTVRKKRLVVALGALSPHFVDLRLRYARLMDALQSVRKGWYFCKVDARSGFYQVKVKSADSAYLGIALEVDSKGTVEHLAFDRLPMGLGPSGFIFSLYSAMVHSIFRARLKARGLDADAVSLVYVDDFLVFASSKAILLQARAILLEVMAECGMTVAEDKSPADPVGPGEARVADTALGLCVNLDTMSISLPDIKLVKLFMFSIVLHELASKRTPVPTRALAQQGGRLTWLSMIECTLPAYIRPLQQFGSTGQGRWKAWARSVNSWTGADVPRQVLALAHVLRKASAGAIRGSVLLASVPRSSATFYVSSDASGPANAVCIATQSTVVRFVLPDCGRLSVPALEALATPLLFWHYGTALLDATLIRGTDALGVCYQSAAGKSRRDDCNDLQKLTLLAATTYNTTVRDRWVTRWGNFITDTGAGYPLAMLAERSIKAPPVQVELVVKGLPHEFLGDWARSMDPHFVFDEAAWLEVNDRGGSAPS
jgi:hypothetical protein